MQSIDILLLMILCHIIDDFLLQQKLAEMKQRSFWQQYPEKYHNDYIICLLLHGTEWGIMVSLPILLIAPSIPLIFYLVLVANILIHAYVDHLKCNSFKINLIQDQLIHLSQTLSLFLSYSLY